MYEQDYISATQPTHAIEAAQQTTFLHRGVVTNDLAPHFNYYMRKELASILHVKLPDLSRSGVVVSTTLDLSFQSQVLKIARDQIAALKGHNMTEAGEDVIDNHTD